jgi:hypothetical protein
LRSKLRAEKGRLKTCRISNPVHLPRKSPAAARADSDLAPSTYNGALVCIPTILFGSNNSVDDILQEFEDKKTVAAGQITAESSIIRRVLSVPKAHSAAA